MFGIIIENHLYLIHKVFPFGELYSDIVNYVVDTPFFRIESNSYNETQSLLKSIAKERGYTILCGGHRL